MHIRRQGRVGASLFITSVQREEPSADEERWAVLGRKENLAQIKRVGSEGRNADRREGDLLLGNCVKRRKGFLAGIVRSRNCWCRFHSAYDALLFVSSSSSSFLFLRLFILLILDGPSSWFLDRSNRFHVAKMFA